jgi:hypothetical protein
VVVFPNNNASILAKLVRHMAPSVGGKTTFEQEDGSLLVDNTLTLYHALGSLQGVQWARDQHHQSLHLCDGDNNSSWAKTQRQRFAELARSLGMSLNHAETSSSSVSIIPGLDELVHFIQERYRQELEDAKHLIADGYYNYDSLAVLYPPGSRVVVQQAGVDMMCRVVWNRYQQGNSSGNKTVKYFQLCLEYIVAVGTHQATMVEVVQGFLTSNRVDSLDPAFQTRITLSLSYDNLDAVGRAQIWNNLLEKSGIITDNPDSSLMIDTMALASFPLNGREIKNALRLALALAAEKDIVLDQNLLMETASMITPATSSDKKREDGSKCFSLFGWW